MAEGRSYWCRDWNSWHNYNRCFDILYSQVMNFLSFLSIRLFIRFLSFHPTILPILTRLFMFRSLIYPFIFFSLSFFLSFFLSFLHSLNTLSQTISYLFFTRHIILRCSKKQTKSNPRSDPKSSCVIENHDMEMLPRSESRALSVQSCFVSLPEMVEVVPKSRSVLW